MEETVTKTIICTTEQPEEGGKPIIFFQNFINNKNITLKANDDSSFAKL